MLHEQQVHERHRCDDRGSDQSELDRPSQRSRYGYRHAVADGRRSLRGGRRSPRGGAGQRAQSATGWNAAEFNIFGDCCWSQTAFSNRTTIIVKTSVVDGTTNAPSCGTDSDGYNGFTAETNNLTLAPPCCAYPGSPTALPAIEFLESNLSPATATCGSSGLQAFTTLLSFDGTDGQSPEAALVQAIDGNLYGTTGSGGANGGGTIFKISLSGKLTTLYNFCSQSGCADGNSPYGGLVQVINGDFYGTTQQGGAHNGGIIYGGTVYKITTGGTLTTLYSFCAQSNCADGSYPSAVLVQAADGDFYGTTTYSGGGNCYDGCGTVFKISPLGALTTLHTFAGYPSDGGNPSAGLVQGGNGDLYGTTYYGGATSGGGTIYKITTGGTLTTLYSFCAQGSCADGYHPAGLVQGTNGDFYGTTQRVRLLWNCLQNHPNRHADYAVQLLHPEQLRRWRVPIFWACPGHRWEFLWNDVRGWDLRFRHDL